MVYHNLKALIKGIRACKTLADERALIQNESAAIRTSFKEEDTYARHNNIAKLLYIHMLGYPAHFGQIECLKLVASPRFSDKRLGYLGIMLLLDENQEVLTLVTNSLKNDMNHSNMYAVGLALCTFGNISSEEMSRDLSHEIEKLLGSTNTYIRKKAALCALRVVRRVPDLLENYVQRAKGLLQDRNHGVWLTGVTLITEMCQNDESCLEEYRKAVPLLVKQLKSLVTTGYSPEHDVSGITDPFLQIKILRLLRLLGKGNQEASDTMNDILAQVATNTDSTKNVGNSILYETVLTVLHIEADTYTASKLYSALLADISQESLTLAAVWIIGEYGEALIESGLVEEEEAKPVTDENLVNLLETVLNGPYINTLSRQFVLTALIKLTARPVVSQTQQERITEILGSYATNPALEIQQRSVEYINLYNQPEIRSGVLEQMPAPEIKATVMGTVSENRTVGSTRTDTDSLLDLDSDLAQNGAANVVPQAAKQNTQDLLADIFGSSSETSAPVAPSQPAAPAKSSVNDILGLFDSAPAASSVTSPTSAPTSTFTSPIATGNPLFAALGDIAPQPQQQPPAQAVTPQPAPQQARPLAQSYIAYDGHELKISLTPAVSPARPGVVNILARFQVSGGNAASNVNFQAAVPKTQQLQMLPMSNQTVAPGATETQQLRVIAPAGAHIRLRIRVAFTIGSENVQDQVDFSGFPPNLTTGGQ
ncbi:clathrin associated protein complex large subunit [Tulasnella sp. UAMH 9824]|nr:clathrin associated protein complex large subunit [Tulasnella sp. UAMH 9824]